ncbi:MAG: hypothetical protein R2857_15320 [Vampirovibrionales bacterium]
MAGATTMCGKGVGFNHNRAHGGWGNDSFSQRGHNNLNQAFGGPGRDRFSQGGISGRNRAYGGRGNDAFGQGGRFNDNYASGGSGRDRFSQGGWATATVLGGRAMTPLIARRTLQQQLRQRWFGARPL